MNNILFIENRHRTRMWEIIAEGLAGQGHSISWMVMNHGFAPQSPNVSLLPYPRRQDLVPAGERFRSIAGADRRIRYYGYTADHYVHYDSHIRRVLKQTQPDIVIGEATQFYELLAIEACRDFGIGYIAPASARYPTGRFICCEADTLDVVGGSGEAPAGEELSRFVNQLVGRTIVPDYMKAVAAGKRESRAWKNGTDWAFKALQYFRGERYCSPPPLRKLGEGHIVRRSLALWNQRAREAEQRMTGQRLLRVLFPLHKQPEASVDVWGRPYSNQAALIDALAASLGDDAVLMVKPNPKPGLELSDALFEVAARRRSVIPLATGVTMQQAFEDADLIVTVTGTVAIESIFARKPCATLIRTRNNDVTGCRFLNSPAELGNVVGELRDGTFALQSEAEVMAFAARLYAESYPGIISDPYSDPGVISQENRKHLTDAFNQLIPALLANRTEMQFLCSRA